jgi:hypothetical protein
MSFAGLKQKHQDFILINNPPQAEVGMVVVLLLRVKMIWVWMVRVVMNTATNLMGSFPFYKVELELNLMAVG